MDTQKPTGSSEPAEQNQDTTCSVHPKQEASQSERPPKQGSLVPKGTAIGLAVFAIVLSLSGYGFRLLLGEDVGTVLRHAAVIVPTFVIGIPLFFWVGSRW